MGDRKKCVVLSLPHSGTHFAVWLLAEVLKLDVKFQHFHQTGYDQTNETLSNLPPGFPVIVPYRLREDVEASWTKRGQNLDELQRCKDIMLIWMYVHRHLDWITLDLSEHTYTYRFNEILHLVNRLGITDSVDPENINLVCKEWPIVRRLPHMNKMVLPKWQYAQHWISGKEKGYVPSES